MRNFFRGITFITISLLLSYIVLAWGNNRSAAAPDLAQLESTLEKGIQWLEQNREKVLSVDNPMLWHLVQQAATATNDARLQSLFQTYERRHLNHPRLSMWRPLFYPGIWEPVRFEKIRSLPYYNWHFIYAISCDTELAKVPEINAQNDKTFCDYSLSPACVTHQLMGFRLLQRSECGDMAQLDNTNKHLQKRIRRQLILDPRVVDVYMQRVLMFAESGAADTIRPSWIKNLIDAQQPDGGWSSIEPLVRLGDDRYFGFGSRFFAIAQPQSDFHMTAQGVFLFSLLSTR